MATALLQLAPDNSSDAAFRLWGKGIADQIIAFGWTRTSDTGMINWTTVTRPTSSADYRGYDVFQMGDTLNGTTGPMVLKIQYGGESSSGQDPALKISVANRSNGSGTLLGNVYNSAGIFVPDATRSTDLYRCTMSGATNRLAMALWDNGLGGNPGMLYFSIERSHDSTATDTDDGFIVIVSANSSSGVFALTNQIFVPRETLGSVQTVSTHLAALVPYTEISSSSVYAGKIGIYPIFPYYGIMGNPSLNTAIYKSSDISLYSVVTARMYGANHTFRAMGGSPLAIRVSSSTTTSTDTGILMRYE